MGGVQTENPKIRMGSYVDTSHLSAVSERTRKPCLCGSGKYADRCNHTLMLSVSRYSDHVGVDFMTNLPKCRARK